MGTIGVLRGDHSLLRKKLLLLESALQLGPEGRVVLREMSFSLLRCLQEHMHREAHVLEAYHHRVPTGRYLLQTIDHSVEQRLLRAVHELVLGGARSSVPVIILRLSQAIDQLRAQMDAQEQVIFSALDEVGGVEEASAEAICGAMSVNEVLHRYPQTQAVFDQLHVNRFLDGYESVDEVAWRHGIDVTEIIDQLRQAVTFSHW